VRLYFWSLTAQAETMCASYGLGGGLVPLPDGLEPYSEIIRGDVMREWVSEWGGKANTSRTRKDGRTNLNPVIWQADTGELKASPGWWWLHVGGEPAKYTA